MTTQNLAERPSAALADRVPAAPFKVLSRFLRSFNAGVLAAREFETLSGMSNAALAKRGLKREDICRRVFEKHFAN